MPFQLPTTVHPTEYICVTITIPNEETYRRNFVGQIHQLTRWFNHERDDARTAKQVGEEWMKAYLTMQIGDCDEMACCPDEVNISYATYRQTQINYQQFLRMMDDGDTAASFGAPPTFNGDDSDARRAALCRTINRLIHSVFNDAAMGINAASGVIDTINRVFPSAQPLAGILSIAGHVLTNMHLMALAQECDAMRQVACCLRDGLGSQDTTIDNMQHALDDCGFSFGTPEAEIAGMVNNVLQNRDNARAFIAEMANDYDSALQDGGAQLSDCDCECACPVDFDIVSLNGCQVIPLGDCQWRIIQDVPVSGAGDPFCGAYDYYTAEFAESTGQCIDIIGSSGTAMSAWEQTDCNDEVHSGVGGGGGAGKRFKWVTKACPPDATYLNIIITVAPVA
jgi:hypothetical protein